MKKEQWIKAMELRPGDEIDTDGGMLTRNVIKDIEINHEKVTVEFPNGQIKYIRPDGIERVYSRDFESNIWIREEPEQ